MHLTHKLELFPDHRVTLMLFKEITNAADLRQSAMAGKIKGALINPTMLVHPFQVLVAANKAVNLQNNGKMKTRSLYSEIIFNLSPTNNENSRCKAFISAINKKGIMNCALRACIDPEHRYLDLNQIMISEAFKKFGISDRDDSVMVVLVHNDDESQLLSDIAAMVNGQQIPVKDVALLSDLEKIKKLYKVTPQEEICGTLLDAVVCRMAIKDVM